VRFLNSYNCITIFNPIQNFVSSDLHLFIPLFFHQFKIVCHPSTIFSSIKLIIHLHLCHPSITKSSIQYHHPSNSDIICSTNLHRNGHLSFIWIEKVSYIQKKMFCSSNDLSSVSRMYYPGRNTGTTRGGSPS
jgi:hypothetical protein